MNDKRRASGGAVVDADVARVDRVGGAGFVPCARAAGWIKREAKRIAALFIAAGWQVVGHGAWTRAWIAAGNRSVNAIRGGVGDAEHVPFA